jgi:hypothetical protein
LRGAGFETEVVRGGEKGAGATGAGEGAGGVGSLMAGSLRENVGEDLGGGGACEEALLRSSAMRFFYTRREKRWGWLRD